MPRTSAGLLMFREVSPNAAEVLLVHPGGPFWKNKDLGAWSIPKGEVEPDEEPFAAAKREFEEEIGLRPHGEFIPLGEIRQAGGKLVHGWAFEGDCDPAAIRSNSFSLIWPPNSGKLRSFLEIDRAEWFSFEAARRRILKGQIPFVERLADILADRTRKSVVGK